MQTTYEPPALVEVGSVEELTLGMGGGYKSGRTQDGFMSTTQMPTS